MEKMITVKRMKSLLEDKTDQILNIYLSEICVAIGGEICKSYRCAEAFTIQRDPKEPFDRICYVYGYKPIRVCHADGSVVTKDEVINLDRPQDYYVVLQRI